MTENLECEGVIVSKKPTSGTNKAGQPYKRATFSVMDVSGEILILSTFNDEAIENFDVGANVIAHYHKNGAFNNLDGFELKEGGQQTIPENKQVSKQVPAQPMQTAEGYEDEEKIKQTRIIRQNVLNRATELVIADKIKLEDRYKKAEEDETWVRR